VEEDSTLVRHRGDLVNGLHRSDLVVGVHDRDQDGVRFDRAADVLRIDQTRLVDGDDGEAKPEVAVQVAARAQNRGVLDRARDDVRTTRRAAVRAITQAGERDTLDRETVGLAAARGEDDAGRRTAE
jgi:hypothetical protein